MKTLFSFRKGLMIAAAITSIIGLQSCLDDDDNNYYQLNVPNALVTVKTDTDNTFYLQLDDSTTLLPVNYSSSPFGDKEVRAIANIEEVNEPSGAYTKAVQIN